MKGRSTTRRRAVKVILTAVLGTSFSGKEVVAEGLGDLQSVPSQNNYNQQYNNNQRGMIDAERLREQHVEMGEQVRLSATERSASYESVLETVPSTVFKESVWNCESACKKLEVPTESELEVTAYAPHPEYTTRKEAEKNDEFVEYLNEFGDQSRIVSTAPHGGRIEFKTEDQSRLVAERLGGTDWSCVGFNSGGGAYDRWHITSTELSRRSFPKLDAIADREFDYAVSFHGFGEDGIAVGGGATRELKETVCDAIDDATNGDYEVYIPESSSPYAGNSSANYVNWLTADRDGIQIEQSMQARREDWREVAEAVVSVFD